MANGQTDLQAQLDSLLGTIEEDNENTLNLNKPSDILHSLGDIRENEEKNASFSNRRRVGESPETTFGTQMKWGFTEAALVAPSLWESLGKQAGFDIEKGDIKKWAAGNQAKTDFWDASGPGKAGYIAGAGAGMFLPFGLAGKVASKGLKGVAWAAQGIQKATGFTPFLSKAASRELLERTGALTGKKVTNLTDEAAEEAIGFVTQAYGKSGAAKKMWGFKAWSELTEATARAEVRENVTKLVGKGVPENAVDDIAEIAVSAVRHNSVDNAHAILEATMGRLPFVKGNLTGDILAAMSYDALLGTTYGLGRAMANDYANAAWKKDGVLGYNEWDPEFMKGMGEALHEGAWLSLLGPVRLIAGGTGAPMLTVPRFWNKRKGKVNMVVGGVMKNLKGLGSVTPIEAEATMAMMHHVSGGAIRHYARRSPLLSKAMKDRPHDWWLAIDKTKKVQALGEIRKKFILHAPGMLFKETGKELIHSIPRMIVGSLAMNASSVYDVWNLTKGANTSDRIKWTAGSSFGEGWHDIGANILVAALMTRQGRALRRFDKDSGMISRGDMKQWMEGKNMHLQETIAGLNRLGLSPTKRHEFAMSYRRNAHFPGDYSKGLVITMLETNKEYKYINERINEKTLDEKSLKELDVVKVAAEGKDYDLASSYGKAIDEAKLTKEEKKQWLEDYKIARQIIDHIEGLTNQNILLKPMTPKEARQFVTQLAEVKINGNHTSSGNIAPELIKLQNTAAVDTAMHSHNEFVQYYYDIAQKLGLKNVKIDPQRGIIYAPDSLDLPSPMKEAAGDKGTRDRHDMLDQMRILHERGLANGWIEAQKASVDAEVPSSKTDWDAAVEIHNNRVLGIHQMVYGMNQSRESLEAANNYDGLIMTADSFHIAYRQGKKFQQGENVRDFLFGNYDNMGVFTPKDKIRRIADKAASLFGGKVKISEDSTKNLPAEELESLTQFVKDFNRLFNMSKGKIDTSVKEISVEDANEMKKFAEELFGDAFRSKETLDYIENIMLNEAVEKLDLHGTTKDIRKAIISLQLDSDFSQNQPGVLRSRGEILGFLDMMRDSHGKDAKEVEMLKSHYDDITSAVGNSDSKVIRFEDNMPTKDIENQLYNALKNSEFAARDKRTEMVLDDAMEIDVSLANAIVSLGKQIDVLIDADTNEIEGSKKDIYELLDKTKRTVNTLTNQITVAKKEGNLQALRSLAGDKVNIGRVLDEIIHAYPNTVKESYQLELAKIAAKMSEINQKITKSEIDRITEENIVLTQQSDSFKPIHETENTISPARFYAKYFTDIDTYILLEKTLNAPLQTEGDGIRLLERAKADIISMHKSIGSKEDIISRDIKLFEDAMAHMKSLKNEKRMSPEDMTNLIMEPMRKHLEANILNMLDLKVINHKRAGELFDDLGNDLRQIMQSGFSNKQIRTFEYNRGGWELAKTLVPNTDRTGFLGIESYLGLEGNIFLLRKTAITADGNKHNFITKEVMDEIKLRTQNPMKVNSRDAEKEFLDTMDADAIKQDADVTVDFEGRQYTIVTLDESTSLVVEVGAGTHAAIKNAYRWNAKEPANNSDLMKRLNRIVDVTRSDIREILKQFQEMKHTKENISRAILLARAIVDSPSTVEQYMRSDFNDGMIKAEWKRLKMYEPKSGFTGTKENIDFMYSLFQKTIDLENRGVMNPNYRAFKAVKEVFGEKGEKPMDILVIDDESASKENEGLLNPFSHYHTAVERLKRMKDQGDFGSDPNSNEANAEYKKQLDGLERKRSSVDAVTYVNKKTFEALMAILGVKPSMIQYTANGYTIRAGAIKPIIAHSEVKDNGEILDFLLKTSFQYDPSIEAKMPDGVNAITFKSAAKKFSRRDATVNGTRQDMRKGYLESPLIRMRDMGKSNDEKIGDVINGRNKDSLLDNIASIPLSSINLKNASREHTGLFSANTAVHFSEFGMEGAAKWTRIIDRMGMFQSKMRNLWLNTYARTAIGRDLLGYSAEIGDQYLVNTGLDYILRNNGLLTSEWMMPILERSVISHYLNGGKIAASQIYESSTDIMAPDNGRLALPWRTTLNGKPVQRAFGGGKVSQFNADKKLKLHGERSLENDSTDDTSALVVKFSDGTEGIMVGGLSNREKASDVATLYVDGFMIKVNEKGKLQIYDMSEDMSTDISEAFGVDGGYPAKYAEAKSLVKDLTEKIDYKENPEITLEGGINMAKEVLRTINNRETQAVWFAGLETRQPRNQAGDLILAKLEGITEGRGNVHETNIIDANQTLDADNDFDKVTTYHAATEAVWGEAARLAGYTTFNKDIDIQNYIEKQFEQFGDVLTGNHPDNVIETALVRSRFVKMHQTLTYLKNMFGDSNIMDFNLTKGSKNFGVRLKRSEAAYLNTSQTISKFVKHFIDIYKDTPREFNSQEFVQDAQRRTLFHPDDGIFEIYDRETGQASIELKLWDKGSGSYGRANPDYMDIIQALERRFIQPINKYLTHNRGESQLEGQGYSRSAGIQEFSSAYERTLTSMGDYEWAGILAHDRIGGKNQRGNLNLDIKPGLHMAREYFRKSINPFDVGMRAMYNLNAQKHKEIDLFESDLGKLVTAIDEGYIGDRDFESKHRKAVNLAYGSFIENEMNMARVSDVKRRLRSVELQMSQFELRYKRMDIEQAVEYQNLSKQKIRLTETVEDLRQVMGAGRDWKYADNGQFQEYTLFKKVKQGDTIKHHDQGKFTNFSNGALVIRNGKGNVSEIIPKGKTNQKSIYPGYKGFEHGRHYEFASQDQTGAYLHKDAFGEHPAYRTESGEVIVFKSTDKYGDKYTQFFKNLKGILKEIDNDRYPGLDGRSLKYLSSSEQSAHSAKRKRALHKLIQEHFRFDESTDAIEKWAVFHTLLRPEVNRNVLLGYPVTGGSEKKMAFEDKVTMHDFGRTEQLVWEYLKDVADTSHDRYKDSGISAKEADQFGKNIITELKIAAARKGLPYADMRLAHDGFYSEPLDLSRHYLYSDIYLNQSVYDKTKVGSDAVRAFADVLVRYAQGEGGLIDPFTLYKAQKELTRDVAGTKGIPLNETFMSISWERPSRAFGSPLSKGFKTWNTKGRFWGGSGLVTEKPLKYLEDVTRCLKP